MRHTLDHGRCNVGGGGIYNSESATLINCVIEDNTYTTERGGGIAAAGLLLGEPSAEPRPMGDER